MTDDKNASYAALILRLSLGVMFLAHAMLKILVFTPAGTVKFFNAIGVPGFLAYVVIAAELAGAVLLIAGVKTRLVALALTPILLGTIILVHGGNGWGFANQGGGWEYPLFLIMASFAQAFLGDGAFALKLPKYDDEASSEAV